jgi:hypothetical protein
MGKRIKMYIVNRDLSGKLISGVCAGCGHFPVREDAGRQAVRENL